LPSPQPVDGEAAGGGVEQRLRFLGGFLVDAQVGILRHFLGLPGVAQQALQVAAQGQERVLVKTAKGLGFREIGVRGPRLV
jgi:hypothetical protein